MSLESVRAFFAEKAPDISVIESTMSSATVVLAAEAYSVEPARIAKTLSLRIGDHVVLIVASGTARMDNKKVKALFGIKPKMLGLGEVADITGHEVGGVCPFGLKTPLPVYCDLLLKAFDMVHSAVRITPQRMAELTGAEWIDARPGSAGGAKSTALLIVVVAARLNFATSRPCWSLHTIVRFEHRATGAAEMRGVVPEATDNPVDVGDLRAAQPEHIRRAGHLLFHGAAIFLRDRDALRRECADGDRNVQHCPVRCHMRSFLQRKNR
jgi:prolyl-tRNA editing enzyme YbaK/EbsC (Cys-tRNA(Pro) deacylase)